MLAGHESEDLFASASSPIGIVQDHFGAQNSEAFERLFYAVEVQPVRRTQILRSPRSRLALSHSSFSRMCLFGISGAAPAYRWMTAGPSGSARDRTNPDHSPETPLLRLRLSLLLSPVRRHHPGHPLRTARRTRAPPTRSVPQQRAMKHHHRQRPRLALPTGNRRLTDQAKAADGGHTVRWI